MRLNLICSKSICAITVLSRRSTQLKPHAVSVALAVLLINSLPWLMHAQTVASCQKTAPISYPPYVDTSATTPGWSPTASVSYAKTHMVLGDIDGDGEDELVALTPQNQIQVWHWIQTGWTSMAAFPSAQIATHPPSNFNQVVAEQINLADVTGNGQKDVVVFVTWENSYAIPSSANYRYQEQIYHRNPYTGIWTELTNYVVTAPSIWFQPNSASPQEARLLSWTPGQFNKFEPQTWTGSTWQDLNSTAYISLDSNSTCANTGGPCISFADLNGDGYADLTALRDDGTMVIYLSFPNGNYFAVPPIHSKVPSIPTVGGAVNSTSASVWQISNSLLLFRHGAALFPYKFTNSGFLTGDFVEVGDPAGLLYDGGGLNIDFWAFTNPIISTITVAPMKVGPNPAIVMVSQNGVYDYMVSANSAGQPIIGARVLMNPDISINKGFGPSGYSGYFQFGIEGSSQIMIARSSSGVVNRVPSGPATSYTFVDPETLTTEGYPSFTASQQLAYEYIGANTAGNPDLRSLYSDPAASWANIETQIESLAAPPVASGISLADYQYVQKQLVQEVAALQSVNLFYGVTGQILTNTYLVKDATLSEITDVLALPSQPDVSGAVLNDLTTALGGLGAAAEGAGVIFKISQTVSNALNGAGTLLELLGTVTGDSITYTSSTPVAADTYDLKTSLDDSSLGALTANACSQLETLSSWNQSKPIADGILTGTFPLDLATQQDVLQATQSLFQLYVWQALVPSKWSYVSAIQFPPKAPLFPGNANYPASDTVPASCPSSGGNGEVSLVLEDPSTHNFPNLYALNALFDSPPNGLGANPADVFFGHYGWVVPYVSSDPKLLFNTGLLTYSCSGLTPILSTSSVAQTTGSSSTLASSTVVAPTASTVNVDTATPSFVTDSSLAASTITTSNTSKTAITEAIKKIGQLEAGVEADHPSDPGFSQHMVTFLDVAITRLKQVQSKNQTPLEALRLLNLFINQSQWNAKQGATDSKASSAEAINAVRIRDSLLAVLPEASSN